MTLTVNELSKQDRTEWQTLYHGYAEFYKVPMNDEILDTVWGWIHDENNPFFGLIAKDEAGNALGLMHCREMASPLRGALVGFLDDLFVTPEARGRGVVDALYHSLGDLARERDWPFVRWITAEDNYRGRAVYDRLSEKTRWVTYQMAVE
jgi:ribosomal protein S18 acetylase RimI-like enzyme